MQYASAPWPAYGSTVVPGQVVVVVQKEQIAIAVHNGTGPQGCAAAALTLPSFGGYLLNTSIIRKVPSTIVSGS